MRLVDVLMCCSFCLYSCVWPFEILQWIPQWERIKCCGDLGKGVTDTLAMIRQAFGEESTSLMRVFEWRSRNSPRPKKARQMKSKFKSMLVIFFNSKGTTVDKELVLAGQTVNSASCCNVLWWVHENVWWLRHKLWWQEKWLLHHDNTPSHIFFSTRDFSYQKQHDCRPSLTLLAWLCPLRLSRFLPFWHNWGDRGRLAGSAEHNIQNAVKNGRRIGNGAQTQERTTARGWWAVGPTLVLNQMVARIPEIVNSSRTIWNSEQIATHLY
jgi:hypothetical protein